MSSEQSKRNSIVSYSSEFSWPTINIHNSTLSNSDRCTIMNINVKS